MDITRWLSLCRAAVSGSEGQVRSQPRRSRLRTSVWGTRFRGNSPRPTTSTRQCYSRGAQPRLYLQVGSFFALPHVVSWGVLRTAQYSGSIASLRVLVSNFRPSVLRVGVENTVFFIQRASGLMDASADASLPVISVLTGRGCLGQCLFFL